MFNVGEKFIAKRNYPVGIEKEVREGTLSFDVIQGEEIEIAEYNNKNEYTLNNNSINNWFIVTETELKAILN